VEELKRLVHAVGHVVLVQDLVELREADAEEHGGHVLEAVDPLLALGALTSDVDHDELVTIDRELRLNDTFIRKQR